ncbi:MAG: tyrosine-type recombinase/integrase, partial [Solirubrobacteraceae bacterium]
GCLGVGLSPVEMCDACRRRWRVHHPDVSRAEFVKVQRPRIEGRRKREVLCRVCCVPGFERPSYGPTRLCMQCYKSYRASKLESVDEWIAGGQARRGGWRSTPRPPARPRPSLGWCERCGRRAANPQPVSCVACLHRWTLAGRPEWDAWRREHPWREDTNPRVLVLRDVAERLMLEFLVAVQDAISDERRFNAWGGLTRVAAMLSASGARSVLAVQECPIRSDETRRAFSRVQWAVEQALVDPGEELARDVWRLGLLRRDGGRSKLELAKVTQPWLREIFRDWAREALATRKLNYLRSTLCQIVRLSVSLQTRPDAGQEMTAVDRRDIEHFLMRLAGQASAGAIANSSHVETVIMVRALLRRARERGLTAPGGRLYGLPDTFALYESDTPQKVERDPDDEVGRSLPNTVIQQLAALPALARLVEQSGQDVADAAELLIRTGRRPSEICHLTVGCLHWDERMREDGTLDRQPVLVYRPEKTPKRAKRLPVHAREALIITRAAERARARFPEVAAGRLPLFPRPTRNRSGTVPISPHGVSLGVRRWCRALPELLDSDGTPFDRERVYVYAFRHSYAQRLADSGCSPHVLMDIMDHRAFATTEGYCRIRQDRRRQAVDLERRWQWDAQGNELEQIIERFAESEEARMRVGSTAIPYGSCVEPSNVAALGSACPYRMRCVGCKHFRTDLTHLGALEKYLTDLLGARERIFAASDELADWARRDAMPSDEHIGRVRHLIGRMRQKIDSLAPEEASEVRRILGSQASDRRELGDLSPAAFQLSVIAIDPTLDPARS